MKKFHIAAARLWAAVVVLLAVSSAQVARAEPPMRAESLLVWGTNDPQSPDPKHIPVDEALARKLNKGPFRWKYFYQVNRQVIELPVKAEKKGVVMSSQCALDFKNLGGDRMEIKLYGKGKLVSTHKEALVLDWPLIFSGSAENQTAWLVVVRKIKPGASTKPESVPVTRLAPSVPVTTPGTN